MFNFDQLDDGFGWVMKEFENDDNNDGNDVGITGAIDIENENTFEVTRIQVHFRWY